jgi:hypothetical protein
MHRRFNIILTAVLIASSSQLIAQEPDSQTHTPEGWIAAGIGTGLFGPSICGNFSYFRNGSLFTARYFKADEFRFNVDGSYDEPAMSFREGGILYGRYITNEAVVLGFSAGLGYARGTLRGREIGFKTFTPEKISTISVPFEITVKVDIGPFALGGAWYGSVNKSKSFSGVMVRVLVQLF